MTRKHPRPGIGKFREKGTRIELHIHFLLGVALILHLALALASEEPGVSHISEQCGKWTVSFNWSDFMDYEKSASHMETETGSTRINTDMLTLTSNADSTSKIKIGILKYSKWNTSLAMPSNLMKLANSTLIESGSCKNIRSSYRIIDGRPGAFASGSECRGGKINYAAAYVIDSSLSRSSPVVTTSSLCTIFSTYDQESTDRLIDSIHVA
jgi:hypothetical protein